MSIFVLDSNFFIQAHRGNYPLDVASGFWNKVKQFSEENKIISIDKVKNEIYNNEDELKRWCINNLPKDFFKETISVVNFYAQIVEWAKDQRNRYLEVAISEFLDADEADAWLISYSLADSSNRIIVTQEFSEPLRKNKIKIPDVCIAKGIQYCNTIEMFRMLNETF